MEQDEWADEWAKDLWERLGMSERLEEARNEAVLRKLTEVLRMLEESQRYYQRLQR